MTTPLLALLLTGCAPNDAEVTGSWHVWLAANNSATVDEGKLDLVEQATRIYDCARGWDDETGTWEIGYVGPRSGDDVASGKYFGGQCAPGDASCDQAALDEQCSAVNDLSYYPFLQDDGYYYLTQPLDVWRSEAIMNGEGDFQLTLHNKLGNGQDMRLAFSLKPGFAPVECTDEDGDGVATVNYTDGASWLQQWSADEDGHNIYYLNAGSFQVEPSGGSSGPGSESDDPEYWYFTSEWSAGFAHAKFAAEEFVVRAPDYGAYDEAGEGPNYNLVEDFRNECAASRTSVPPLVDAGPNQHMWLGETLTLDGSATIDMDGDSLTTTWKISSPSNSGAELTTDGTTGTFTPISAGNYTLSLEAYDGAWRVTDTIMVTVEDTNHVPYCDAVGDMLVSVGDTVSLDATASDIDGDDLDYDWSYIDPAGSLVEEGDAELPEFDGSVLDFTFDTAGTYSFLVDANDADGESCRANWVVTVQDAPTLDNPPLCYGGVDLEGYYGDSFDLDLGMGDDVDGGSLSYAWTVLGGPATGEAAPEMIGSGPEATFTPDASGTWTLRLEVTDDDDDADGTTLTCTSDIVVTVRNNPPLCDIPGNVYADIGESVSLSDRSADDPDGNAVTSTWTLDEVPECSTTTLTDNGDGSASMLRDIGGTYSATYEATDGDKTCSRTVTVQSSCDDNYLGAYTCHTDDAAQYAKEISHLAMAGTYVDQELSGEPGFVHKTESNFWRPIDDRDSGLDGWAEVASSWVRITDGSNLEVGGTATGDFQVLLQGFESSSYMVVEGSFVIDKIRKDTWAYPDLEDIKRDESGVSYCGGDTVDE